MINDDVINDDEGPGIQSPVKEVVRFNKVQRTKNVNKEDGPYTKESDIMDPPLS